MLVANMVISQVLLLWNISICSKSDCQVVGKPVDVLLLLLLQPLTGCPAELRGCTLNPQPWELALKTRLNLGRGWLAALRVRVMSYIGEALTRPHPEPQVGVHLEPTPSLTKDALPGCWLHAQRPAQA